jgi:hypothetical protein
MRKTGQFLMCWASVRDDFLGVNFALIKKDNLKQPAVKQLLQRQLLT